jgi:predicted HicB family RNase H-like nuclease
MKTKRRKENRAKAGSAAGTPKYRADDYHYSVSFSEEDQVFIGRVAEFSSLAAHGTTLEKALRETCSLVESVIEDLEESGEALPEPFRKRSYSGRINVRMPEHLHRQLAIEAQRQRVSLNQWINAKLEIPIT